MAPPRWKTSLVISQRTNHTLNRPINAWAPGVYKGAERSCPHGNLRTDGHSSFVHNRPNLEVTEMSLRRGMETQTVVHSDSRCYPALKTCQPPSREHTWRNFKCIILSERSQSEKVTSMRFRPHGFLEKTNYGDSKRSVFAQGGAGGGRNERINRSSEVHPVHQVAVMGACYCAFVQTHRMYTIKKEPEVNCGLCVMMTRQRGFIPGNKHALWWQVHMMGGLCTCGGRERVGNLCTSLSSSV